MMYFDIGDGDNKYVMMINWISNGEGVEAQQRKFMEIKDGAGSYLFIYTDELTLNRNKKEAYQTFIREGQLNTE